MPCHARSNPTISKPPVYSFAIRIAASFASPPVERNMHLESVGGSSAASFSASRMTGGERRLECRCATCSDASRMVRSTRSEEHTSELQSLMRISYAVFCLKKKKPKTKKHTQDTIP